MVKGWVIAWTEDWSLDAWLEPHEQPMFMVHTFSLKYVRKLIKYLEEHDIPHKWCSIDGYNVSITGFTVGQYKQDKISKVIQAVFRE